MKICTKCKIEKDIYLFPNANANKDGRASWCRACYYIATKEWRIKNPLKTKNSNRDLQRKYRELNPEKVMNTILKRVYNISIQEYNQMLKKQNEVCAICKNKETSLNKSRNKTKALAVDHDHKTNKIRGLLCSSCNTSLGSIKDNITTLENMIKYLKEN